MNRRTVPVSAMWVITIITLTFQIVGCEDEAKPDSSERSADIGEESNTEISEKSSALKDAANVAIEYVKTTPEWGTLNSPEIKMPGSESAEEEDGELTLMGGFGMVTAKGNSAEAQIDAKVKMGTGEEGTATFFVDMSYDGTQWKAIDHRYLEP